MFIKSQKGYRMAVSQNCNAKQVWKNHRFNRSKQNCILISIIVWLHCQMTILNESTDFQIWWGFQLCYTRYPTTFLAYTRAFQWDTNRQKLQKSCMSLTYSRILWWFWSIFLLGKGKWFARSVIDLLCSGSSGSRCWSAMVISTIKSMPPSNVFLLN
jgi:hypothetical protein